MQSPQYTPMKKMEVDMRPLDAEEEKAQEGRHGLSISDLYSVIDVRRKLKKVGTVFPYLTCTLYLT